MKIHVKSITHLITLLTPLVLLISSVVFPTNVHAFGATITVTSILDNTTTDGYCSLREAIVNANANAATFPDCSAGIGTDAIVFSNLLVVYTVTLGSTLPGISDAAGLTIYGDDNFTISGNNLYRIFIVNGSASLTLDGLTVANGKSVSGVGAGALNAAGTLIITNCLFSGNSSIGSFGGGIYNVGILSITDSIFSANSATYVSGVGGRGAGIYNATGGTVTLTRTILSANSADIRGGGIYNYFGTMTIIDSSLTGNSMSSAGDGGGGIYNDQGTLTITHSSLSNNHANSSGSNGGGLFNSQGTVTITLSTFSGNSVTTGTGGGIASNGTMIIGNSTFSTNYADFGAGIYNGTGGTLTVRNTTFSGNTTLFTSVFGGGIYNIATLNLYNTILANTVNGGDCYSGAGTVTGNNNLIESATNACGFNNGVNANIIGSDPNLGAATLINPVYFPLNMNSTAINKGDDTVCAASSVNNTSQNGLSRPQGSHCDIGSYELPSSDATVDISISNNPMGTYSLAPNNYRLQSYPGTFGGPLFVDSTNNVPDVASIRLLYLNKFGINTLSELMGVPTTGLLDNYWMPVYLDDAVMDSQIRFTNTSSTLSTNVSVYIGGDLKGTYTLGPNSATRVRYEGFSGGPVQIVGTPGVPILAGMRIIYAGGNSFDEIMAYPTTQLSNEYWFPFYNHNNVNLDTEIRIGNTSSTLSSNVNVYIGGVLKGTYTLAPNTKRQITYAGLNGGPVRIVGTSGVPLVTSLRLLYLNRFGYSTLSELMGVPTAQLLDNYAMPVYLDDTVMDSQVRFTNTSTTLSTTVNVYLGTNLMGTYVMPPSSANRIRFTGVSGGPVRIVGTPGVPILAGMRIIYAGGNSFDEIMAYPTTLLSPEYWFPFYNHNNVNLDTEVRIGVP